MSISKSILGLFLIILCCTAWGKTYEEYVKEARSKSKVCLNYEETKLRNSKANREQSKDYMTEYLARQTEEGNLASACGKDMRQYLPPEALPLLEAHKKAYIAEQVSAGFMNPDGTHRNRPFYANWTSWDKFKESDLGATLEFIGQLLLWPIMIITLLLGLMLITKPQEFFKMMQMAMQGIVKLLFKKN